MKITLWHRVEYQAARLAIGAPGLRSLPRGDGRPVLVARHYGVDGNILNEDRVNAQ